MEKKKQKAIKEVKFGVTSGSKEVQVQITPETLNWLQNPFEILGDYSHLQELTLSSPSIFRPIHHRVHNTSNSYVWPLLY